MAKPKSKPAAKAPAKRVVKKASAKAQAAPIKRAPTAKKAQPKAKVAAKPVKAAVKAVGDVEQANPVGRPSSYKPEFADQGYKLTLLGATDKKLAEFFEVSESTLNLWKLEHPEFSESITRGKELADGEIAESLFHRAKGYSHPEDDIRTVSYGPAGSEIVITPTVKHYPPDTAAASLWLRNRQPKLWRDKTDVELGGPGGGPIKTESKVEITADEAYKRMLGGK